MGDYLPTFLIFVISIMHFAAHVQAILYRQKEENKKKSEDHKGKLLLLMYMWLHCFDYLKSNLHLIFPVHLSS